MASTQEDKRPEIGIIAGLSAIGDKALSEKDADVTLRFLEKYEAGAEPLAPAEQKRMLWKLHWRLFALIIIIDLMLYIDKATLSYASILGIFADTHIGNSQYNNLNTIYYVGYVVAQAPGHWLMQRLPLGKYVGATIFSWAVLVFLHCAAYNYGGLIALRFFLGAVESSLVPAMEMSLGMFFQPQEQTVLQPLFWISCMGAPIPAGFIAYGLLWSESSVPPWKLFMIITGGVTLFLGIYSWFYYPSNPTDARFLNTREKVFAIKRVHEVTRSSIEQKRFKPYQFWEALRDPISWLFLAASFTLMISNNLAYQQNLLFVSLGVSTLGSTLVSAASGGYAVVCCIIAAFLLRWFPGKIAHWGLFWCLPVLAGGIGMVTVPWGEKLNLLACLILAGGTFGITYIVALGWTTSSAAGYTKKMTRNVMFMVGYGIANIISPQIWVDSTAPRYYPAWIVQIVVSWVGCPLCLFVIRWILSRRNVERRRWIAEQEAQGNSGFGYVEKIDDEGNVVTEKVEISLLDLTDLENKFFIYPLLYSALLSRQI
ncbi:putative transporter [Talaromyces atroroseus]|uniref:Putative transporter n=1 Tax=Talaromyces atroroseus TaxID=1441469 RepID=A0A225AF80_TALAT|nr:putative transporter [Talaromyces atroroseus]OKL59230.1 putative transporter [Talaromyces atroroseus]